MVNQHAAKEAEKGLPGLQRHPRHPRDHGEATLDT